MNKLAILSTVFGFLLVLSIVGLFMWGVPKYNIWSREQSGKAQLAEAEWSKKVAVEEARARNDSATLEAEAKIKQETAKAQAEIIRARGVAEAQKIIAETLTEEYIRYLWITNLESGSNKQTIYVPTEAGLPVLEAQRLGQ